MTIAPALVAAGTSRVHRSAFKLLEFALSLMRLLKFMLSLLPMGHEDSSLVVSPYAGNIPMEQAPQVDDADCVRLTVGSLNPGRSGLANIGNNTLLEWRLWAIVGAAKARDIQILVLPGARFPLGALLPQNLGYCFLGPRSSKWDTVGILCAEEVEPLLVPLDDFSTNRVLWLSCADKQGGGGHSFLLCGFYAAPGGDLETWTHIITSYKEVQRTFPGCPIVLAGDGNAHLKDIVHHELSCSCLHCRQSSKDATIEAMILEAGLKVLNPDRPTHCSGTIIDLVLVPRGTDGAVTVEPDFVGGSDHNLLFLQTSFTCTTSVGTGVGRISWLTSDLWDQSIDFIEELVMELRTGIEEIIVDATARPQQLGGQTSKKLRRGLIDAAAWARDVLIVLVGHLSGLVRVQAGSRRTKGNAGISGFHEADRLAQRKAVDKYVHLLQSNPQAAEQFLAKFFTRADNFEVHLLDDNGFPLSDAGMLSHLVEDMMGRANNSFPQDQDFLEYCRSCVADFRRTGQDQSLGHLEYGSYSMSDLVDCLVKINKSKKCLKVSFAVILSPNQEMRKLTLALANLSLHVGLTSSFWSLRQFAHIRKSGPKTVRSIKCLRPVSLVCDMAHVIDALWIQRNRQRLEMFAGPCQLGGVSSAILTVLALLLLAQARHHFGLATFLITLDLKWAFDVAPLDCMRLACIQAKIDFQSWLILDDILATDQQCVQLHGLLSSVFILGCGTAQGRRFSVHVFNSMLKWLADAVQAQVPHGVCLTVPEGLSNAMRLSLTDSAPIDWVSRASSPNVIQHAISFVQERLTLSPGFSSKLEITEVLTSLNKHADRAALVESLGEYRFHCFQYVDDAVVPCASQGDVAAIVNRDPTSAASIYAAKTKSKFHYGAAKTCCLPVLDCPEVLPEGLDCDVVMRSRFWVFFLIVNFLFYLCYTGCSKEVGTRLWLSFTQQNLVVFRCQCWLPKLKFALSAKSCIWLLSFVWRKGFTTN
eukprot:Skav221608  [mRNA]  locus=scaffold1698:941151:944102:- [translate_table: standard]